jgi:hypothetical protein
LKALAGQVREAHAAYLDVLRSSAARKVELGRLLAEARPRAGYGQWAPFLREAGVNVRTANDAIGFFNDWPLIEEENRHGRADLTVTVARRRIAAAKAAARGDAPVGPPPEAGAPVATGEPTPSDTGRPDDESSDADHDERRPRPDPSAEGDDSDEVGPADDPRPDERVQQGSASDTSDEAGPPERPESEPGGPDSEEALRTFRRACSDLTRLRDEVIDRLRRGAGRDEVPFLRRMAGSAGLALREVQKVLIELDPRPGRVS